MRDEQAGFLSEDERLRLLRIFDAIVPSIPKRPLRDIEKELTALSRARKAGGRKSR